MCVGGEMPRYLANSIRQTIRLLRPPQTPTPPNQPDSSAKGVHRVARTRCAEHIRPTMRRPVVGRMCLAETMLDFSPDPLRQTIRLLRPPQTPTPPNQPDSSAKGVHRVARTRCAEHIRPTATRPGGFGRVPHGSDPHLPDKTHILIAQPRSGSVNRHP